MSRIQLGNGSTGGLEHLGILTNTVLALHSTKGGLARAWQSG